MVHFCLAYGIAWAATIRHVHFIFIGIIAVPFAVDAVLSTIQCTMALLWVMTCMVRTEYTMKWLQCSYLGQAFCKSTCNVWVELRGRPVYSDVRLRLYRCLCDTEHQSSTYVTLTQESIS